MARLPSARPDTVTEEEERVLLKGMHLAVDAAGDLDR